ncbi:hypothetical protein Lesp02_70490 [Lentzea sp. NBRC 105346]|uniref:DUF6248 family natural product biosynthesis protein n=1 Tax=Lentzea sp. NBRC 105346 TaxID=3032205 RepID=UPI0024A122B1|nr:DUF6248 family natural product biosynthesis protein [Lentzea sp. NBRC 105346]GLZ34862.1 hypothetical protein Lesp02_70490 [Lentzea sp. NBRC 105346]
MTAVLEVMPADHAEWIRGHAWTGVMRKTFRDVPGAFLTCACQYGLTDWCKTDRHDRCRRGVPLPTPETCVRSAGGKHEAMFDEPLFHRSVSATGGQRVFEAFVWLADRVCRWVCPCGCHGPREHLTRPVQTDLFAPPSTREVAA